MVKAGKSGWKVPAVVLLVGGAIVALYLWKKGQEGYGIKNMSGGGAGGASSEGSPEAAELTRKAVAKQTGGMAEDELSYARKTYEDYTVRQDQKRYGTASLEQSVQNILGRETGITSMELVGGSPSLIRYTREYNYGEMPNPNIKVIDSSPSFISYRQPATYEERMASKVAEAGHQEALGIKSAGYQGSVSAQVSTYGRPLTTAEKQRLYSEGKINPD